MEKKIEGILSENQFGFRKKMVTREAMMAQRLIVEKRLRKDKSTFIVFVDIKKTFDNVNWEIMFKMVKRAEVTTTERKLLYQLFNNKIAIIKMGNIQKELKIKKSDRQECTLSPLLFNVYIQEAHRYNKEENTARNKGKWSQNIHTKIRGRYYNNSGE